MGPLGIYLIFGYNGEQKGGIYIKPPEAPGPANWLPYVRVPSVDAAIPAVEAGGAKVINGPMEVPGGSRIVVVLDSAGAAFALHSTPVEAGSAAKKPAAKPKPAKSSKTLEKPSPVKAKPKAAPKVKAKPKAKTKTKAKPKVKAKTKVKAKAKAKTKTKAKAKTKAKTKAKAKKTARRKK
jgi:hypothetical protein